MKLFITDKFLWDLYSFLEKISDIYDIFAPRPWREVWCPELHKFWYERRKRQDRKNFSQLIYYLKKKGYIKIKNLEQKQAVLITKKGADKVLKIKFKIQEKKKRPDGKWQMIIFDIPERKRHLRDLLREYLHLLGYKMLQQSVWVCPYDVLKETEAILRRCSLDPYVKLFLIEEVEL
ncbi:MAG: CRISPR-associated endonuclease Cas2 [Patescibacteria group bacterium]|nr:CRISPR-associated endonuclease Cas2 [Patescibacteria group bacterium]